MTRSSRDGSSTATTPAEAHVAAAMARHGRRGWRIDKAGRADKIDAVVALAMALDRVENRPAPTRLVGWL